MCKKNIIIATFIIANIDTKAIFFIINIIYFATLQQFAATKTMFQLIYRVRIISSLREWKNEKKSDGNVFSSDFDL
ncbi:MAG TPA: hypothetical protein DCG37_08565 [Lachnospiraceae bacterium]|nr:hypothetical protein [Lachnospiraceae bacterium]